MGGQVIVGIMSKAMTLSSPHSAGKPKLVLLCKNTQMKFIKCCKELDNPPSVHRAFSKAVNYEKNYCPHSCVGGWGEWQWLQMIRAA